MDAFYSIMISSNYDFIHWLCIHEISSNIWFHLAKKIQHVKIWCTDTILCHIYGGRIIGNKILLHISKFMDTWHMHSNLRTLMGTSFLVFHWYSLQPMEKYDLDTNSKTKSLPYIFSQTILIGHYVLPC